MSQIIFDQYLHPGDRVKVEVYVEDGSLHTSYYAAEVYGNVVALVVEES